MTSFAVINSTDRESLKPHCFYAFLLIMRGNPCGCQLCLGEALILYKKKDYKLRRTQEKKTKTRSFWEPLTPP